MSKALAHLYVILERSFTHLVGGMGVLVFALAVIATKTWFRICHIMESRSTCGPVFGKVVAKFISFSLEFFIFNYLSMAAIM